MCVKSVRRAPIRRAIATACSSVKCVGCGRRRSASSTRQSRPSSSGERRIRNAVAVGQVREPAESKPEHVPRAVLERHGIDFLPSQAERGRRSATAADPGRRRPSAPPARRCTQTCAGSRAACARRRRWASASGERVVPPHIVEPHQMVGVRVRVDDRVDAPHVVAQRLRPEVRRRVHEHAEAVVEVDDDRRARSRVARIVRPADLAIAADHRDAVRRPGAEKQHTHETGMVPSGIGNRLIGNRQWQGHRQSGNGHREWVMDIGNGHR